MTVKAFAESEFQGRSGIEIGYKKSPTSAAMEETKDYHLSATLVSEGGLESFRRNNPQSQYSKYSDTRPG